MEVNKKQLADIFGASIRTIQNWQEQGMPVLRGGGKGNEVLYDSAAVIRWYAERDAEIENEKLRREVEELRQASETDLQPEEISLKLYQKPSRKKSVRGVTRKHQTVRLQSPSAMIITLTARLLFRPLFLTV